jgi:hypothetical protein
MSARAPIGPCLPIWRSFIDEVNTRGLSVLEIGARASVFGAPALREHFPNAREYVGFDINEGPGVDLVGDVHRLSSLLHGKRFGAIHSTSVFEHLAMPWIAAIECIKALHVGGIMFQHFPFAWPEHEEVDGWRFTRQSFGFLFPPAAGMDVEAVGADHPLHMHMVDPPPGQTHFHESLAHAYFGALMRKNREADLSAYVWPLAADDLLAGRRY